MDESIPVPAATGNSNEVVLDEPACHLYFQFVYRANAAPAAALSYRIRLAGGVAEGETDGSGRLRVDRVPADDYLVEIGDQRMHLTAFARAEGARTVMLMDYVTEGSPPTEGRTAREKGEG